MTWINITDEDTALIEKASFSYIGMERLYQRIMEARAETLAHAKQIEVAREHCDASWDTTVEVDIEPPVSPSETGVWVGAWVWVPEEE